MYALSTYSFGQALRCSLLILVVVGMGCACGTVAGEEENGNGNGENGDQLCTEGERRCVDEATAERCSDDKEWETVPCATGTICDDGFCLAVSCEPGERRCRDDLTAEECSETGTRWVADPCPEPGACTESGVCVSYVCWPHETRCATEEIQEACAADGSGWSGTFCLPGEQCLGISCAIPICEPGETECASETHLRVCNAEGSDWEDVACPTPGACRNDTCVAFACEPGTRRCASGTIAEECAADGSGWIADSCGVDEMCTQDGVCVVPICAPRESRCVDENTLETCRADGSGWQTTDCGDSATCIDDACVGEMVCVPGETGCFDDTRLGTCNAEGTGYDPGTQCPASETCSAGVCTGDPCETPSASHLGCEFWPMLLPNSLADRFKDYAAVVVLNGGDVTAEVRVYEPGESVPFAQVDVQPGSSREIHLPWLAMSSTVTVDGNRDAQSRRGQAAFRLTSSRPVAVWQHNPIETELPSGCQQDQDCPNQYETCIVSSGICSRSDRSLTNDAMLLLPTSALGNRYVISSLPHFQTAEELSIGGFVFYAYRNDYPSLMAVAAVDSGQTQVTISTTSALAAGDGLAERSAGSNFTLNLSRYEVVQLATKADGTPQEYTEGSDGLFSYRRQYPASDPTGTIITSNKPVAVYVGVDCRNIPYDKPSCDHLSDQLLPETAWGHRIVAGRSESPGSVDYGDIWRIVAAKNDTQITFVPSTVHGTRTLHAGEHLTLNTTSSFMVRSQGSSHPIHVTQFLVGSEVRGSTSGDPAQVTVPAVSHYLNHYVLSVPASYESTYATIVRPTGTTVAMDGLALAASWQTIGTSGYQVARVQLNPGVRRFTASNAIGITLYGHHFSVSFAAPGGFDLQ